jgi:hypothetical protein
MQHFDVTPLPDRKIIYIRFLADFDRPSLAAAIKALYHRKPEYLWYKPIYDFRSYAGLLQLESLVTPILILRNIREKMGVERILPGRKAFLWSDRQGLKGHQIRITEILANPNILSTTCDIQAWQWVSGERGLPPKLLPSHFDNLVAIAIAPLC